MNSLRFHEIDLEANRQGRLTDAQQKRRDADVDTLRRASRSLVFSIAGMCLVRAILDALEVSAKVEGDLGRMLSVEHRSKLIIWFLVFIVVAGIAFSLSWWQMRMFARSTVHSVEGRVNVIQREKRFLRAPVYGVKVWRGWFWWMMFRFDDAESLAYFESGKRYRIYYLSYFDRPQALSAEELPDEKAKR